MLALIEELIADIKGGDSLSAKQLKKAKYLYQEGRYVLLTQSSRSIKVFVGEEEGVEVNLVLGPDGVLTPFSAKNKEVKWNEYVFAALLAFRDNLDWMPEQLNGKKYTREGMMKRVLKERQEKALTADYRVELADNIYGEHTLYNERGVAYKITLWDFEKETGYINNIDWRTNKLGTTKHIMFLFEYFRKHPRIFKRLKRTYPFVEITLDPFNEYKISWFYPDELPTEAANLLAKYFGDKQFIEDHQIARFLGFLSEATTIENIVIRPEVNEKIERFFNQNLLAGLRAKFTPDYSEINATLFPYQKEGVEFALFRPGVIIADEMGLGKTIQAIATAIFKKQLFEFKRTLVICPASLKHQWKAEIEKFTSEKALVVEGFPEVREQLYFDSETFFFVVNYETVLRDLRAINAAGFDFVILDEAQKIKNYETKTSAAIKRIQRKQSMVITGTPIENKLIDLFAIVQFIDPYFLSPLWEFSYQHCIFDSRSKNRILGYYNLNTLKEKMSDLLIRREKRAVLRQLPNVIEEDIYVYLHQEQASLHAGFTAGIARILSKKFKTSYDWQKLMLLLANMRMVCDSTFLIDKQTNYSPKLYELKHVLLEKLDLKNTKRKVIIFSEWINMLHLIGEMLKENGLGFVQLTGKVPVKKRGQLIETFEKDDDCRIFLSTESGGSGLNLQMADTVINFELPWNPAKKNQRIGRIDRLGQRSEKLTVVNFISIDSIEQKIASGLVLKQSLFDGVLNEGNIIDEVDFSAKGKSQFIRQLEEVIREDEKPDMDTGPILEIVEEEVMGEQAPEEINGDGQQEENLPGQQPRVAASTSSTSSASQKIDKMEEVLNKGMEFLAGIYQMTTGEELHKEGGQKIEIDRKTGEVVMRFKMKI